MNRKLFIIPLALLLGLVLLMAGCDKERIVESTVTKTEYVNTPPDTIFMVDTVVVNDSIPIQQTDTVFVHDTVNNQTTVYDTTFVYDTVTTVQNHYDTVTVTVDHYDTVTVTVTETDTVTLSQCNPNEYLAIEALQQYGNSIVLDFINSEFGYSDGWVYYLTTVQTDLTIQSSNVYDIYGYIDYWTPEFDAYYPLEYYWRMTFNGGDPADPASWTLTDPPAATAADAQPGLKMTAPDKLSSRKLR